MSFWAIGLLVLLVALLIPLTAVLIDAPLWRRRRTAGARRPAASARRGRSHEDQASRRLAALEDEVDDLIRAMQELRDEVQMLQRVVEQRDTGASLNRPKPSD